MAEPLDPIPFQANVELLQLFLTDREAIVESIEAVLNAQRTPVRYRSLLSNDFEDCFFKRAAGSNQTHLRSQLEEAHWSAGFRPRRVQHLFNGLIDPAEMIMRAVHCWQQTRWPGRSDRIHYAQTLFNLYVLRWLQFLSVRIFDQDSNSAAERLSHIQTLLDALWKSSPAGQPVLVRDARWLIPLALSLITDELAPYFEVTRRATELLPEADALEIQKAYVRMLGGHLTSQVRHYSTRDAVPIDDAAIVIRTRTSNALDMALLVQGLVPLLNVYDRALSNGDARMRRGMAGAIFQGISPDPELFLNRVDLLSAYTMIEHVFIATDPDGNVGYSVLGRRHRKLLQDYNALMNRLVEPLREDLPRFKPTNGVYSPYGVVFGLPSSLIEHMALKAIERHAETSFSLEDVFNDDPSAAKLEWVNAWRKLPHVPREVQRQFDYPQQFADEIYERIVREFNIHGSKAQTIGRLHIAPAGEPSPVPELPTHYFVSSDKQAQILAWRREGLFLISYQTPGGWIALKKELLTEVLGAGQDARVELPREAAQVLRLMCTAGPAALLSDSSTTSHLKQP